jgi:hypothetical protein
MSDATESTDLPAVAGPGPNIAQVDPPHPFKAALKTVAIAAVVMCIAIGLYAYLGQRPPVASGEVLASTVYPVHSLTNNGGSHDSGMAGSTEYSDQVLVLSKVRIRNQTDIPLFMQDVGMTIKLPDGTEMVNVSASDKDMDRVFTAYPSLGYLRSTPIQRDVTLNPGQFVEGLAIFNFSISKEQWDQLQTAKVVVQFMHQKNLELLVTKSEMKN